MENINYQEKHKKGSVSHRIFKIVILFIVAVFFYLIFSFIRIQFSGGNKNFDFDNYSKSYNYLDDRDRIFSYFKTQSNISHGPIENCNLDRFYTNHITVHRPCVIRKNENQELKTYFEKAKEILEQQKIADFSNEDYEKDLVGLFTKIGTMKFSNVLQYHSLKMRKGIKSKPTINKGSTYPILEANEILYLQINGNTEYILSPITQLNKLSPWRVKEEDSTSLFNKIFSNEDIFHLRNQNFDFINLYTNLSEGDLLYVPAYFFIQDNIGKNESSLKFTFDPSSRVLKTMFKVLFDDNFTVKNADEDH